MFPNSEGIKEREVGGPNSNRNGLPCGHEQAWAQVRERGSKYRSGITLGCEKGKDLLEDKGLR